MLFGFEDKIAVYDTDAARTLLTMTQIADEKKTSL